MPFGRRPPILGRNRLFPVTRTRRTGHPLSWTPFSRITHVRHCRNRLTGISPAASPDADVRQGASDLFHLLSETAEASTSMVRPRTRVTFAQVIWSANDWTSMGSCEVIR